MKSLVPIAIFVASSVSAIAQGTVIFSNDVYPAVQAPVFQADRVTALAGSQFQAELLAGPSEVSMASIATTGFLSQGYFFGGVQYINSVVPNQLTWIQIRVWDTASGASFLQAQASGRLNSWWQSAVFTVNPGAFQLPAVPLMGLGTSPVYLNIPEPSAVALVGIAGLMALVYPRRRNRSNYQQRP